MSVRRSLAWLMMSQGGFFVLQFSGAVVLARLLTPYEMGVYTAAAAVTGILGILQAFGLTLFIIREPDLDRHILAVGACNHPRSCSQTAAFPARIS